MRVTLKAIDDELARRGHLARLARASGYFYFHLGEAAGWLDRTVSVPEVNSLSLKGWLAEYDRLKKLNQDIHADEPEACEESFEIGRGTL